MKNKTVFSRVFTLLVIVLILYLILGTMGLIGFVTNKNKSSSLYNDNLLGISNIDDIAATSALIIVDYHKAAIAAYDSDKAAFDAASAGITDKKAMIAVSEKAYEDSIYADDERALFNVYKTKYAAFENFLTQILSDCQTALNSDDYTIVKERLANGAVIREELLNAITAVVKWNENAAVANNTSTQSTCNGLILAQVLLLVITIPLMFVLAGFMLGAVEKDLKTVAAKLIVSSESVESAATQLNEASDLLALGSSKNAAAIEETSATMNESASMISQNAENTRHAAQLAHSSNQNAMKGKEKMDEMVHSMEELKESSDTISKIIKTIDDIAFQTNLLAINATVEAARAGGEAGRSFAVVADEVRTLAQRSAKAAADTEAIIEKNISLTNSSREVSHEVASTLTEITAEFENLNKIIDEINAASEEQAAGIRQINQAISQMEKTTQENAAVAEENAATANSMKDEIYSLNEAIELQKSIVRDPSSINNIINKGMKTSASPSGSKPVPKAVSPIKSPVKTPASSAAASKTNKFSADSDFAASKPVKPAASQPTEAEKIIPLDEDDDF